MRRYLLTAAVVVAYAAVLLGWYAFLDARDARWLVAYMVAAVVFTLPLFLACVALVWVSDNHPRASVERG